MQRYHTDTCTIEAHTVPKQIDRETACPLGRGPEVLCGVRLIIILLQLSFNLITFPKLLILLLKGVKDLKKGTGFKVIFLNLGFLPKFY